MKPIDMLSRIRSCDRSQPYIYVSYSSKDHARVWEDVLVLQELGYNVWLGEKNLDETKDSWKKDALAAISDMNCKLLFFYVSRHSLCSRTCYYELAQTIAEETTDKHFGPVPFIAIDVEDVGDIDQFIRSVYQDCIKNPDLTKEEQVTCVNAINGYRTHFFDSKNPRLRIHPKDEPNRTSDYYEEITGLLGNLEILPIYPPVRELPGKKREEDAASAKETEMER